MRFYDKLGELNFWIKNFFFNILCFLYFTIYFTDHLEGYKDFTVYGKFYLIYREK